MTTSTYELGSAVEFTVTFLNDSDTPTDPTVVKFLTQSPDGTVTTYTYGTDSEVTKADTGDFVCIVVLDESGLWRIRWEGTGAVAATFSDAVYITSPFDESVDLFASVTDLNSYTHMDFDPGDPFATMALAASSSAIRKYCEQTLTFVEDDEVIIDGTGSDMLILPEYPVSDVSEVSIDDVVLDEDEYALIATSGMVFRKSGVWPITRQSVAVTYSHGYIVLPTDLKLLCVVAAARSLLQDGASTESVALGTSFEYAGQPGVFTDDERRLLDKYRRRHVR
jgi:hypothetical protein